MTAPGGDAGTIRGKIVIDADGAKKGVDETITAVSKLEKEQKAAASRLQDTGKTMAKVYSGAVVGGLVLAINAAKDFDQALANVAAAGGKEAAGQMDLVRKKALQLGADTSFSATEAASAMEALIKAGLSVSDTLNGAADAAVNLAAAEGIDLTKAAEIAATAMTAFNLKASDMPAIANKISQAASATKMDVTDFAQAMNQAGAVSKLIGLSFDDMTLAITAMGKAGIVGSDAGTSLKTMLMNLQPATAPQRELFDKLGLTTEGMGNKFFDATGKVKSMTDIAGVLEEALKGMSEQQKIATLETLFGSDAIRAGAIIAGQGAAGMAGLTAEMGKQLTVAEKAKVKQDTFAGSMEKMMGSVESAAIIFGTGFLPVLRQVAGFIEKAADGFSKLPAPLQQAIGWFLIGSVGLLGFGFAAAKVVTVVKDISTVLQLGKAIGSFASGMQTIGAAATMTAMQVVDGVKRMAVATAEAAASAARSLAAWAVSAAQATARVVVAMALAAASAARSFAVMIAQAAVAAAEMVATAAIQVAGWIRMAVVAMANALIIAAAWLIANPWILIAAAIIALVVLIVANWDSILEFLTGVWNWIKDLAATVWNAIADFFIAYWPWILGIFTGGIGLVVGLIIQNWDAIKDFFISVWTAIADFFVGAWNTIVDFVVTAATTVWTTVRDGVTNAYNAVSEWIGKVIQFFRDLPENILSALRDLVGWLTDVGRNMMEGLINGVKAVAGRIKDAVLGPIKDSVAAVKSFLGISSPSKLLYSVGVNTGEGFENALLDKAKAVATAMRSMMSGGLNLTTSSSPLSASAAQASAASSVVNNAGTRIANVTGPITVAVTGNLDPTDPVRFRSALGEIKTGLRDLDRESA